MAKENNVLFVVQNSPAGNDPEDQTKGVYFGHKMWQITMPEPGLEGPWVSFPAPYWYTYGGSGGKKPQSPYPLWYVAIDGEQVSKYGPLPASELQKMPGMPDVSPDDPNYAAMMSAAIKNPHLVYPVDLSNHVDGFDNLVLTYPYAEGGALLFIAAMVKSADGGPDLVLGPTTTTFTLPPGDTTKVPPLPPGQGGLPDQTGNIPNLPKGGGEKTPETPAPINGSDDSFPIEKAWGYFTAEEDGGKRADDIQYYPLENFVWNPTASARYGPEHGAWVTDQVSGISPTDPDKKATIFSFIDMVAKQNLQIGNPPQPYHFDHWEWQSLLDPFSPPDQSDKDYYPFNANTFSGLIAYYLPGYGAEGELGDWKSKGDPKDHDDPITPAQFLTLIAHQVSYDVSLLARGVLSLFRHAPGTAGHGEKLTAPETDAATRARLAELAQRHPGDGGALERELDALHR